MENLSYIDVLGMFKKLSESMSNNCDYLCSLDSIMGDGDLGITMKKGFLSVYEYLKMSKSEDIGEVLSGAALNMMRTVPSTMGTLMASGLLAGASGMHNKETINTSDFAKFLESFSEGVRKRGKCVPGDCTVLDALVPASEMARKASDEGRSILEVAKAAFNGALSGVEQTKNMVTTKGKAAVFKENSIGKPDQGAIAASIMIKAFYDYILLSVEGEF